MAAGLSHCRFRLRKDSGEEGEKLMQEVWDLGHYPMESTNRCLRERLLADRLSLSLIHISEPTRPY